MTKTTDTANYRLTNGDLYHMDAGQLREHLVCYVLEHGRDGYAEQLLTSLADRAEVDYATVAADLEDALALLAN